MLEFLELFFKVDDIFIGPITSWMNSFSFIGSKSDQLIIDTDKI
jgi:hypothetical protein